MRTSRRLLTSFVLTVVLGLSACVSTWETSPALATQSSSVPSAVQNALAPTGVLRVGVYLGSPTSWVRDPKTGQSFGIAFELGHALGQQLGVPVQVVTYPRVAEVIEGLKKSDIDMTFTNASPARAKEVDFTAPLIQLELGILVPANSRLQSFNDVDLAGVRLGVSQGSSSQAALGARLKQAAVVPVASLNDAQRMLQRGELDAFATNKGILFELAEQVPGARVLKDRWGFENLAIAVPKGRDAGMPYLRDFAQARKQQGDLQRMAERAGLRGLAETDQPTKER
ncbi:MAG: transporter substrate-binding domain-containing protein [Limnohabitans sp.]|nr:transporter substrate-binding domain-containing protein [Limnohabitans sp.]